MQLKEIKDFGARLFLIPEIWWISHNNRHSINTGIAAFIGRQYVYWDGFGWNDLMTAFNEVLWKYIIPEWRIPPNKIGTEMRLSLITTVIPVFVITLPQLWWGNWAESSALYHLPINDVGITSVSQRSLREKFPTHHFCPQSDCNHRNPNSLIITVATFRVMALVI